MCETISKIFLGLNVTEAVQFQPLSRRTGGNHRKQISLLAKEKTEHNDDDDGANGEKKSTQYRKRSRKSKRVIRKGFFLAIETWLPADGRKAATKKRHFRPQPAHTHRLLPSSPTTASKRGTTARRSVVGSSVA